MASINKVTLIGHVGGDPEIRFTEDGTTIANFSLATNENWTAKDGTKRERTEWHRIEVFGKPAEIARDFVRKGKPLYVEGSIKYEEYVDKEGVKKTATKIRVNGFNSKIFLLGHRTDTELGLEAEKVA